MCFWSGIVSVERPQFCRILSPRMNSSQSGSPTFLLRSKALIS